VRGAQPTLKVRLPAADAEPDQDPDRYPPPVSPDPARSRDCWGYSAVPEILRNPKYTGYMVWNRRASKKGGRHNPPEAWIWSPQPTHQPIVSRELFAAAQHVAGQRRGSRSGAGLNRHPQTRRSYPLRSLVTCELCGRKMRGKLRRKARREYVYYACEPPRSVGRQVAAQRQPEHPASVLVRGDLLLRGVLEFFALRLFGPERRALLAQDLPNVARGEVAAWEARVQALQRTLADLQSHQARLVRTLEERDDPGGTLFEQIARRLGDLHREQQTKLVELRAVVAQRPQADEQSVDLLELLPLLTPERLATAPEPLLRTLFERFQLQVRYHKPQKRATVRVAVSDESLGGLLASVNDIEGGEARQAPAISSAGAVSLVGGAPRGAPPQTTRSGRVLYPACSVPGGSAAGVCQRFARDHGPRLSEHVARHPVRVGLQGLLRGGDHDRQPRLNRRGDPGGHLRGGVAVMGAHGAAELVGAATGGLVAHQLVDHPGRDAGVLQPGREGVPKVVGAAQAHRLEQRIPG
jgi:hypothetical protein